MDKIAIIFSTITGNAFRLAEAAAAVTPNHVGPYNIRYVNQEVIDLFDTFVLSYWCNHGTADDDTIDLIHRMQGKKIIIIGTLGAARDSAHAQKVCENVENLVRENNQMIGHYLCRGSIDLNRTARRLRIPEGQKAVRPAITAMAIMIFFCPLFARSAHTISTGFSATACIIFPATVTNVRATWLPAGSISAMKRPYSNLTRMS